MARAVSQAQLDQLCEALAFDRAHADCVAQFCEQLFAQTRHLHGLTKTSRPLLQVAATLHSHDGTNGIHPAPLSRPVAALRRAFPRLTAVQRGVLMQALGVIASADGAPAGTDPSFRTLCCELGDEEGRQVARRIAAVVRIADGLDASRTQDTRLIGLTDDGNGLDLLVAGGPGAAQNAAAALEKASLWNQLMPRPIRSVRVHEGRAPWPGLIHPSHSLAEVGRRILLQQLEQFMSRSYGLCFDEDIEYVHELRVALRRSRSALRVFRDALDGARADFEAELKWFAGELGTVRDLDVFLGFLTQYRKGTPREHRPFLRHIIGAARSRRRSHYRKLVEIFASERYKRFIERFHPMLQAPVGTEDSLFPGLAAGEQPVWRQAPRLLSSQLNKVLRHDRRVTRLTPEDQHKLRIECKRMRYAGGFFADIYPGRLSGAIAPTTALQDDLGEVHDADVYRDRILEYCGRRTSAADAVERDALGALLGSLRQHRARYLKRAAVAWKAFTRRTAVGRLEEVLKSPRTR